jgi:aminopeptidase N
VIDAVRVHTILTALLMASALGGVAQRGGSPDTTQPGIPETLARSRAARISDLRYDLSFSIPARRTDRIAGRGIITFTLRDSLEPLALDFEPDQPGALHRIEAGGITLDPHIVNGHVVLPTTALRMGVNTVSVEFEAGDGSLNRSDDFLYTIFVPARAHEAFPCFDQPDLKARWTLALDVPDGWETIGNGEETRRDSRDGRTRIAFTETQPLPTYLFAFGAGRFLVESAERNGRRFRMLHRETDGSKVARNRDAIFDLHAAALQWLERYTGIPYAFGKFDFLLVPAFQFGGMEHPGAVFYNAPGLMLEESATQNQVLERASTISHETAHMWFGDLVTMRWFTDVWMKEVFANFMAAKIVNPSFPGINHELRFLHAYYPAAYDVDRTAGTNAIRQPLDNLKDAGTLYGAIIYQKAPIVMRQLETMMGADAFRDGLREYLGRYRFGNASWPDLVAILDARTPDDLQKWSRAWVEEAGRPIISTELALGRAPASRGRSGSNGARIERLAFTMRDPDPRRGLTWTQNLQVALGYADHVELLPVRLSGARSGVDAARGSPAPLFVLPNGGGIGYGKFHLDARSLDWLSRHLPEIGDALTRGSGWVTLWDAVLDAELRPETFLDLALTALPREDDELNVQRVLSYVSLDYWKFLPEAERSARAPRVERVLREGLAAAKTTSLKAAYFAAVRNVAVTPPTVSWLTRVWSGEEAVPGLVLAETDFIVLSQELAVRGVPKWEAILQQQVERTRNPDRKARLQFVIPALSSDQAERDRFFASLADVSNRRHEPWVLDGLRYLHHPLRAERSIAYVRPSLELLQEIQRTGDIFFPSRWMDATLGGHRSPESARTVRSFLEHAGPSYPDRLRRIVLSSSDDLFRASGERQRP